MEKKSRNGREYAIPYLIVARAVNILGTPTLEKELTKAEVETYRKLMRYDETFIYKQKMVKNIESLKVTIQAEEASPAIHMFHYRF